MGGDLDISKCKEEQAVLPLLRQSSRTLIGFLNVVV
jgi:hypothetical protein